jgi:hypothetical protein
MLSKQLQTKLWSSSINSLDLEKDKVLIVHKVLSYGDMSDLEALFKIYNLKKLQHIFLTEPMNVYTKSGLSFTKDLVLDMESTFVEEQAYVKNLY